MMDDVDKKIIEILKEKGRRTTYQIAKDVGMSWIAINIRLQKLKAEGFVKNSTEQIGASKKVYWEAVR